METAYIIRNGVIIGSGSSSSVGKDGVQIDDETASTDTVWSSKKTSDEIAEKVDKTDISTTIDSTSTDDTVPSTKAVYDATSNFRKTYTSIKQLGLTIGSETIEDIANSMEDQTRLIALIFETEHNVSIYPYRNGTLLVEKINIYRVNLKFFEDISNNVYVSTYHGAKGFTGWKRLCATSVADVPETTIDLTDTDIHGSIKYMVKSGICYVSAWGVLSDTAKNWYVLAKAGVMPKSIISCGTVLVDGNAEQNGKLVGQLYIDNSNTLSLHIYPNSVGQTGFGSFSYPVAES